MASSRRWRRDSRNSQPRRKGPTSPVERAPRDCCNIHIRCGMHNRRIGHMSTNVAPAKRGLLERLADGPVICAEGYLFELERRGYLQAGGFVPEVVLENPEARAQVHREFVRAASDVVEAFT